MDKSKADFKALRELVGMTQGQLAEALGMDVRSVKRWEHPDTAQVPSPAAWDLLQQARTRQLEIVACAVETVKRMIEEAGAPPEFVDLTYWRDQKSYELAHPNEGFYTMANATSRAVADVLNTTGVHVRFGFTDATAAAIESRHSRI